jgi:hypothetical protein
MTNLVVRIADLSEGGMVFVGPKTARRIERRFLIKDFGQR